MEKTIDNKGIYRGIHKFVIRYPDRQNVGNICPGCALEEYGCSRDVDYTNGTIEARVNLKSPRVILLMERKEKTNCGIAP